MVVVVVVVLLWCGGGVQGIYCEQGDAAIAAPGHHRIKYEGCD
jgi:hypothetical protein